MSFKTYQLARQRLTATYRPHYRLTNDYYRREIAHQTNSLADLQARFPWWLDRRLSKGDKRLLRASTEMMQSLPWPSLPLNAAFSLRRDLMVSCKGFWQTAWTAHGGQTEGSSVTEGSSQRKHAGTSVLKEREGYTAVAGVSSTDAISYWIVVIPRLFLAPFYRLQQSGPDWLRLERCPTRFAGWMIHMRPHWWLGFMLHYSLSHKLLRWIVAVRTLMGPMLHAQIFLVRRKYYSSFSSSLARSHLLNLDRTLQSSREAYTLALPVLKTSPFLTKWMGLSRHS